MQTVEDIFENSDFPFNTQILTTSDFGDLTSSQLDSPFEDEDDKKSYDCITWQKFFKYSKNLKRHEKNVYENTRYNCEHCEKTFSRSVILKRHVKLHEVSRRINRGNKRQRFNSSHQPGPSGYQAPAAEEIKQEVVLI
ncbi:hypothetical protein NPIL_364191 [Nephila pilipes]|uniref:C2H2-type domain-containing protein n=1 Tax=Nephila pilipes TaxID=299642 RepID=A0A8X6N7F0_NEPPI|nr:hypothetical protein NPIL_364191 [Nephila pilipes]